MLVEAGLYCKREILFKREPQTDVSQIRGFLFLFYPLKRKELYLSEKERLCYKTQNNCCY